MMIRFLTTSLCSLAFVSTLSLSPVSAQAGLFDDIKKVTDQGQKIMKTAEDIANIANPSKQPTPSQQANNAESAITFFEPEVGTEPVNASIEGFTPQMTFPQNAQFVIVKLPKTYTSRPWPKLHDLLSQPDQKAYVFRADAVANGYENPHDCTHFITSHDKFTKGWVLDSGAVAAGSGNFNEFDRAFPQVLKAVLPTAEPGLCSFSTHHRWKPPGHMSSTPSKAAPMPTVSPSFTMDAAKEAQLKMITTNAKPIGVNPYPKIDANCAKKAHYASWRIHNNHRASHFENFIDGGHCQSLKHITYQHYHTCRTDEMYPATAERCLCQAQNMEKMANTFYFKKWSGWKHNICQ